MRGFLRHDRRDAEADVRAAEMAGMVEPVGRAAELGRGIKTAATYGVERERADIRRAAVKILPEN